MDSPFNRLIRRLSLKEQDTDTFIGGAGAGGIGGPDRLFGGLVAAQATMAALNTVTSEFTLHSLHSYFLLPGRAASDIHFNVERDKNGKNFQARTVQAIQNEQCIFKLQASFMRPEPGVHHAPAMPEVQDPTGLPNRDQLRGRANWADMPIDVRMADAITADQPLPAKQRIWIRANGDLPEDRKIHFGMLTYATDRSLLDTTWRPHADQGTLAGASLDHSIWFHEPPDMSQWLLYAMTSPVAHAARGLAFGHIFTPEGRCIATVAQEGLLRST